MENHLRHGSGRKLIDKVLNFLSLPLALMGLLVFALSAAITRLMIWVGIKDLPVHRSSHDEVTPRGGGIGIILGFFVCMYYFFSKNHLAHIPDWKLTLITLSCLGIVIVSIKDDITNLSLRFKLFAQIIAATAIVAGGLSFNTLPLPYFGVIELGALGGILSLLWVIFFTNAFNFMDGLDGLAAGSSFVASFFGIIIGLLFEEKALLYISFALFTSTFGFLIYNFSPARIFMGDVGSQFLGLLWSVILLLSTQPTHDGLSVYTVPLLFFAFIYDVSLTILRRLGKKQSIFRPHRTFLFHILNRSGLSHRRISVIYMGFAILQGLGAIGLQYIPRAKQIFLLIPYLGLMLLYTKWAQVRAHNYTKRKKVAK